MFTVNGAYRRPPVSLPDHSGLVITGTGQRLGVGVGDAALLAALGQVYQPPAGALLKFGGTPRRRDARSRSPTTPG